MATVKLEKTVKTRSYDETVTNMTTFIDGLAALDTVYASQIVKVAEKPAEYWGAIIIWSDDA